MRPTFRRQADRQSDMNFLRASPDSFFSPAFLLQTGHLSCCGGFLRGQAVGHERLARVSFQLLVSGCLYCRSTFFAAARSAFSRRRRRCCSLAGAAAGAAERRLQRRRCAFGVWRAPWFEPALQRYSETGRKKKVLEHLVDPPGWIPPFTIQRQSIKNGAGGQRSSAAAAAAKSRPSYRCRATAGSCCGPRLR